MLGLLLCCNLLSCYVVSLDLCEGAGNRRCSLSTHLHATSIHTHLVICSVFHADGVHMSRVYGNLPPPRNGVVARDDARCHLNMYPYLDELQSPSFLYAFFTVADGSGGVSRGSLCTLCQEET